MDELQISGKRFISSRRVAREQGYTSDYIGQLIRKGSLAGQKVGRAWYVEAGSLATFLGGEATPIVEEVVAALEPVSVAVEKEEEAAPEPEPEPIVEEKPEPVVVAEEPILIEKVEIKKEIEEEEVERRVPLHVQKPIIKKEEPRHAPALRYIADEEPAMPQLTVRQPQGFTVPVESHGIPARAAAPSRAGALFLAALALTVFGASAFVFSAVSLNLTVEEGTAATAAYSIDF